MINLTDNRLMVIIIFQLNSNFGPKGTQLVAAQDSITKLRLKDDEQYKHGENELVNIMLQIMSESLKTTEVNVSVHNAALIWSSLTSNIRNSIVNKTTEIAAAVAAHVAQQTNLLLKNTQSWNKILMAKRMRINLSSS